MNYPTLSEYNQTIARYNGLILKSLVDFEFIPSRTVPFKMFQYGAGTFAGVFKARKNNLNYAIRCFITSEDETLIRYKSISNYLNTLDTNWQVDFEYLENEINIEGKSYPVIKMEWIDGELINEYVTKNITNITKLALLQEQLILLSDSLERNNIGHGDLQSGNIIIQDLGSSIRIRLIDYDGMYVPVLNSKLNIEKGRPEFQHPNRNKLHYNSKIDRFSIWVMITALEALKYDSKLWNNVNLGGYNTGDNFLFVANDFIETNNSQLFNRLLNLKVSTLNFYLIKLKYFCNESFINIEKPELSIISQNYQIIEPEIKSNTNTIDILSDIRAEVYNSVWVKIGKTPLNLPKDEYVGKVIYVQHQTEYRKITIKDIDFSIKANFIKSPFADAPFVAAKKDYQQTPKTTTKQAVTQPVDNSDANIGWILLLILGVILFFVFLANINSPSNNSEQNNSETVDSTAAAIVDSASSIIDSASAIIDSAAKFNEFGDGNGKVSIWNFHGNGGKITIKLNGEFIGNINQFYDKNTIPDCKNNISSLNIIKNIGQYTIQANDESGNIWRKIIDINEGECIIFRIDFNSKDLLSNIDDVDSDSAIPQEENEIVNKCKFFLENLGASNCKYAFKQTFIPEWEAKGEKWFCSSSAYGGVNIVDNITLKLISNSEFSAKVRVKYYANDIYRGPDWYDQIFELQKYDDGSWLIVKIKNI